MNIDHEEWYFIPGKMLYYEEIVPPYTCGSQIPVYMKGGHPTEQEGEVTRQVCAHLPNSNNQCSQHWDIKVKKCPKGDFYIYKLQRLPDCNYTYCTIGKNYLLKT